MSGPIVHEMAINRWKTYLHLTFECQIFKQNPLSKSEYSTEWYTTVYRHIKQQAWNLIY